MERLKKTVGLILLVSFSLCFISVPALAENPWHDEDRPRGPQDPPLDQSSVPSGNGPGGRQVLKDGGDMYSHMGYLVEISYQLAILMGHDDVDVKAGSGLSAVRTK